MSSTPTKTVYLLKAGDQLGVYRIVRPLGAGGMGEVYLVEHEHLRKRYALKILPEEVSAEGTFIDRFRIEARVMADLEHPGIVRVHNFGEDQRRHYLVMDYVEGPDGAPRTLDDELAWGKKLPEKVALDLTIQLCDALEYAHSFPAGSIIHRDLKPGNILIHRTEQKTGPLPGSPPNAPEPELRVKVADFGLAKIVGSDYVRAVIDRSTRLTVMPIRQFSPDGEATEINTGGGSTVSLLGTYDYMSPEQKTGGAVDARSDIYSLGLILYRMLTGQKPEGTYDPPSKSGVSRRWDPILARCLKRNIEERYQTAAELKKDLVAMQTPVHRRVPILAIVAVAASVLTAALVLAVRKPEATPTASAVAAAQSVPAEPGEVLLPFAVETTPAGADVTVRRGLEVVAEAKASGRGGATFNLKPGVYTFRVELAGHHAVERDLAVGADQEKRWRVALDGAFGYLNVESADDVKVSFLSADGKQVSVSPPDRVAGKSVYKLPIGSYEVVFSKPDHEAASRPVVVQETVPSELSVRLSPLPGSVLIASAQSAEIWEDGKLLGRTGERMSKIPAGSHTFELRRADYRPATLAVNVPPNGEAKVDAPALEQQAATLTVNVEIAERTVAAEHMPKKGLLQIGTNASISVSLPWTGSVHQLNVGLDIVLTVPGYEEFRPKRLTLRDREERTLTFRLQPRPVLFTIRSNVPADVFRLRTGQFATGWKRTVFGRELPIGKTGEPISLDAFVPQQLTVFADGYQAATVDVTLFQPGATNESATVELIAAPSNGKDTP